MTDGRGKQPSKNKPSTGTPADKRKSGRGAKPGPKPKAAIETPFRIKATSWLPGGHSDLTGASDAYTVLSEPLMDGCV